MKKLLIVLASIVGLLLLTIILVPILFKDQIYTTIQKEMDKSVNANINLDPSSFGISLLSDFPNLTLSMSNFSIVGKAPFAGDTLFATKDFIIELDLLSVFNDGPIEVKGLSLNKPTINILVLQDGTANYDITYPSEEVAAEEDTSSEESIKIGVDHWEMTDGNIAYYDQSVAVAISLKGVNHSGSGDFTLSVFDMITTTTANAFSFAYEDEVYIEKKQLSAEMTLGMDLDAMRFTFKDTEAKLNDFALGFEGFFAMPTDDYDMDIQFVAKDNTFKSVLSLVPGMYAAGFNGLETSGSFDFSGFVKGIYNEEKMPAFKVDLKVRDGYVKSAEVPLPIKNISLEMLVSSSSGDMKDGSLIVNNFGMTIDQDKFTAKAKVNNFDSPVWDLSANGKLNLDIISKIQPSTDFTIGGIIIVQLNSKGNLQVLEEEDYEALSTSGSLEMKNFSYRSTDYPVVKISTAMLAFNNKAIDLSNTSGTFGRSDFKVSGKLSNYLVYALQKDGVLMGNMSLNANLLDINEFMGETIADSSSAEDTTAMELVIIPKDIDFTFDAKVNTILYDNYELKNAFGVMKLKEGILIMDPLDFETLGGSIQLSGAYNTQEEAAPKFDFKLNILNLSIPETFKNVVTVQKFMPIAEKMTGNFSTNFSLNGLMTQQMMPDFETLSGAGLINLLNAAVQESKVMSGVTSLAKMDKKSAIEIGNVKVQAAIENGRFQVKPFDVEFDQYKATIEGYTSFLGAIGYNLKLNVPTGSLGNAANQAISGLIGSNMKLVGESVNMNFAIGGTYKNPDVKLGKSTSEGGQSVGSTVKSAVSDKLGEEKAKLKAEADARVQATKDSVKSEADRLKKAAEAKAKKEAEEAAKKLKDKAKNKVKDLFGGDGI
ncbi:MAG: hypothetical protein ACJAT1_000561 [Marivirga sp.]|jgi:hypothetical protein